MRSTTAIRITKVHGSPRQKDASTKRAIGRGAATTLEAAASALERHKEQLQEGLSTGEDTQAFLMLLLGAFKSTVQRDFTTLLSQDANGEAVDRLLGYNIISASMAKIMHDLAERMKKLEGQVHAKLIEASGPANLKVFSTQVLSNRTSAAETAQFEPGTPGGPGGLAGLPRSMISRPTSGPSTPDQNSNADALDGLSSPTSAASAVQEGFMAGLTKDWNRTVPLPALGMPAFMVPGARSAARDLQSMLATAHAGCMQYDSGSVVTGWLRSRSMNQGSSMGRSPSSLIESEASRATIAAQLLASVRGLEAELTARASIQGSVAADSTDLTDALEQLRADVNQLETELGSSATGSAYDTGGLAGIQHLQSDMDLLRVAQEHHAAAHKEELRSERTVRAAGIARLMGADQQQASQISELQACQSQMKEGLEQMQSHVSNICAAHMDDLREERGVRSAGFANVRATQQDHAEQLRKLRAGYDVQAAEMTGLLGSHQAHATQLTELKKECAEMRELIKQLQAAGGGGSGISQQPTTVQSHPLEQQVLQLTQQMATFQQAQQKMAADLQEHVADFHRLVTDSAAVQSDVEGLQTDVIDLQTGVSGLSMDVTAWQRAVRELQHRIVNQDLFQLDAQQ